MEKGNKTNGLGIAALILGIIAVLLSCVAIGGFIGVVALILGIIGVTRKDLPHGTSIAGIVLGTVAIGIVVVVLIFMSGNNNSSTQKVIKQNQSSDELTTELTTEESTTKKSELSSEQLGVQEYYYENTIGDTLHFLVIKNNSDYTIQVNSNTTALDENNKIIGADSSELTALGSGFESCLVDYFDGVENVSSFEYTLSVKEEPYYDSVIQDLQYELSQTEDKAIISVTNTGSEPAEFVEAFALFFKNNELIYYDSTYVVDDDSELKSGETLVKELNCYGKKYDEVKVYFSGRR